MPARARRGRRECNPPQQRIVLCVPGGCLTVSKISYCEALVVMQISKYPHRVFMFGSTKKSGHLSLGEEALGESNTWLPCLSPESRPVRTQPRQPRCRRGYPRPECHSQDTRNFTRQALKRDNPQRTDRCDLTWVDWQMQVGHEWRMLAQMETSIPPSLCCINLRHVLYNSKFFGHWDRPC
ncbi:hypothetical protein GGR57DRAFT_234954 [Xylariaceae sp. FL1272]|nr:hypothetical protein GGR57DRAFT_234954 [Xylariaceae sp. FL1272]